jgi:hypothetical protein
VGDDALVVGGTDDGLTFLGGERSEQRRDIDRRVFVEP